MAEPRLKSVEPTDETVCPDGALLSRHLEGDQRAFGELMRSWATPIYGYLSRCGVPAAERDDLFQEVFCRVHRAAATYRPERPFRPWLFTIVANAARNQLRRQGSRIEVVEGSGVAEVPAPEPDARSRIEARETARWLEAEVMKLPLPQREVVVLCCIEQWEQKEVAEVLEIPVNTVKTHLHRARLSLAKGLARRRRALDGEASR